jgi:hypothetical protein
MVSRCPRLLPASIAMSGNMSTQPAFFAPLRLCVRLCLMTRLITHRVVFWKFRPLWTNSLPPCCRPSRQPVGCVKRTICCDTGVSGRSVSRTQDPAHRTVFWKFRPLWTNSMPPCCRPSRQPVGCVKRTICSDTGVSGRSVSRTQDPAHRTVFWKFRPLWTNSMAPRRRPSRHWPPQTAGPRSVAAHQQAVGCVKRTIRRSQAIPSGAFHTPYSSPKSRVVSPRQTTSCGNGFWTLAVVARGGNRYTGDFARAERNRSVDRL